jgi:hypothetical protein
MKRKADDALDTADVAAEGGAELAPHSPSGLATPPRAFVAAASKRRRFRLRRVVQTLLTRFFGRAPAAMATG